MAVRTCDGKRTERVFRPSDSGDDLAVAKAKALAQRWASGFDIDEDNVEGSDAETSAAAP